MSSSLRFLLVIAILALAPLSPAGAITSLVPIAPSWEPSAILKYNPAADPAAPFNVSKVPLAKRFAPPKKSANAALFSALNVNLHARPQEARLEALISFNATPSAAQGWPTTHFYVPTVWQYIDILGNWGGSGGPISIPSAHVVDAAHRNGVPVLGLVYLAPTVYGGTVARMNAFLVKKGNTFPVADKMIQVARYFKFDGWFINAETEGGDTNTAAAMQAFLKYIKAKAPSLTVTWYDSMINTGQIAWQRSLDGSNQMFFQDGGKRVSDKMFLDFYWANTSNLANSRSLATSLGRNPYDIYAGIDTEGAGMNGKNTWGGDTLIDWTQLFPEDGNGNPLPAITSLGIYRPEWTFNYTGDPFGSEIKYWSGQNGDPSDTSIPSGSTSTNWHGIAHYIPANSPITALPFVTNFNLGQGSLFAVNGTPRMTGPWTNLSTQDILPTWKWIVTGKGSLLAPSLDQSDAYFGGSSLHLQGSNLVSGAVSEVKLYAMSLPVTAATRLRVAYRGGIAAVNVELGLAFEDHPLQTVYVNLPNAATKWTLSPEISLGAYAGRRIAFLTLRFTSSATVSAYDMRFGRLAIYAGKITPPAKPAGLTLLAKGMSPDDAYAAQARLKWTPSKNRVQYYNVYYRQNAKTFVWLGATPNAYFCAPSIPRLGNENQGKIEIEAVGPDFGVQATRPAIAFAFPAKPDLSRKLSGAIIGTTGSWGNKGNTRDRAFDGDPATYFDGPDADGDWVGLDLGSAKTIGYIRFYPRDNNAGRMTSGLFQGSNDPDFATSTTLYTVPAAPASGAYTVIPVDPAKYRYVRYVSPSGSYANIAELEFYAPPVPPAAPQVTSKPPAQTKAAKLAIRGRVAVTGDYAQYRVGDGSFRKAAGKLNWKITVVLKKGRNVISLQAVDPKTGLKSKIRKIIVTRK